MSSNGMLVSVIIPCCNQGKFLGEAIESVLAQTYPDYEIIVVDDGSTDHTAEVAARYSQVRYVHQNNQGTAAARNRGLRESSGGYLVFLDADDRLLSQAFAIALSSLSAHPECGFVFGLCNHIAHDGSSLPGTQPPYREGDDYLAMLLTCRIWHPASLMCRRSVFDIVTGFNTSLVACSDYDFYLQVTRRWPIHCHNKVISEYRHHVANKSSNNALMIRSSATIFRSQWSYIKGNRRYEQAYKMGMRSMQRFYFGNAVSQLWASVRTGVNWRHVWGNMLVVLRYGPKMWLASARRRVYGLILRMQIRFRGRRTPVERSS